MKSFKVAGAITAMMLFAVGAEAAPGYQGVNLQGVNLQGVNLQGVNLQGVDLQGVNLQGLDLHGAPVHTGQAPRIVAVTLPDGKLVAAHREPVRRCELADW